MIVDDIDARNKEFGVKPICAALQTAPSTYYAYRSRPPSARAVSDAARLEAIRQVNADNYAVYRVTKMHAELNRQGAPITRCIG